MLSNDMLHNLELELEESQVVAPGRSRPGSAAGLGIGVIELGIFPYVP